jgi:hypothetical protein
VHFKLIAVIMALSLLLAVPRLVSATEVGDLVSGFSSQDVPAIQAYLEAEQAKGNIEGGFYVDPEKLEIYVNAKENSQHLGSRSALDNARKWGHQFCKDMSKSQHDRMSFVAWHIYVMAWQGPEDGGPNSGYDPVYKCVLGGQTARETSVPANPRDYLK